MLNLCGLVRPLMAVGVTLMLVSILAPVFFDNAWPYVAAVGVVAVPWCVYRWWNARYNPGCSVRFNYVDPDESQVIDGSAE